MSERGGGLFGDDGAYDERLRRTVSFALTSIKSSIERGFPPRALDSDPELAEAWKRAVLRVESVRVDHSTLVRRPVTSERMTAVLRTVHEGLASLLDDRDFIELVSQLRYRPLGPSPRDQEELDPRVFERGETIPDMIATIVELTRDFGRQTHSGITDIAALRRIVP